jgi:solute carrier family 25 (adenine nucleotide translocator) protein 4/5/6/31
MSKDLTEFKKAPKKLTFLENFVLSGSTAVISKTLAAPIERVMLLLQIQKRHTSQSNIGQPLQRHYGFISKTMQKEGLASFWRGNISNCMRYFPTQSLNFAFKDKIKQAFSPKKTDTNVSKLLKNILSGGFAGSLSLSLLFIYSIDYCKTRLINDSKSAKKGDQRQYSGLVDVYRQTITTDGLPGLYRGFVISCLSIFIYRGFYFGIYDTIKPFLGENVGLLISFALGYAVTLIAGLLSYPIDTVRRLMITSGEAVKYNGSLDCFAKIVASEGPGYLIL